MSVPYTASAVLLFTIPQTSDTLQFLYIFVTYNFCTTVCYTAINVPYGALSTLMTRSSHERGLLSIVRMSMAPLGRMIVVTLTMPLVKRFGDDQAAWAKAMAVWASIAIVMLLVCFFRCKECVEIEAAQKMGKTTIRKNISALVTNQYFWATLVLWTLTCIHQTLAGTMSPYYCKYIFNNDTWMYSYLYFGEAVVLILGALACPFFLVRVGKRNLALIGCAIAVVAQCLLFINPYSFQWTLFITVLRAIGEAPLMAILFGMMGDAIEFGQWKNRVRQESLVFGGGSLGFKIGVGITSALIGALLSASGYISSSSGGAIQSDSAKSMIMNIYLYGILAIWLAALVTLVFYRLDKMYPRIMGELAEREERGEL